MRLNLRSCCFPFFSFFFPFLFSYSMIVQKHHHTGRFNPFSFSFSFSLFFSPSVIKGEATWFPVFMSLCFQHFSSFIVDSCVHYILLGVLDALFILFFCPRSAVVICYHVVHHFYSLHLLRGSWPSSHSRLI